MADSVDNLKQHFEDFLNFTEEERSRAEKRRDYRDLKQWTEQQAATLEARGQAPIVFDQFGKKVDGICGLEIQARSDPKAYPVNPKHEKAAEAITDALRYVESHTSFDEIASEVFEDKIVEGYGGCSVEVEEHNGEFKIVINQANWDRTYYDPHSRKKNYSDSKYFGISIWMDVEDAKVMFPDKDGEIDGAISSMTQFDGTTFEDRPSTWIDGMRKRIRVNQEYFMKGKTWMEVFYSGDILLKEAKKSPYEDCDGNPTCPIELESDFVDRDNNRYGYTQRLIDVQDEINHRRSKSLFMLSSKTVIAERGAFGDTPIPHVLDELRKGLGYVEKVPGTEVSIDSQQDLGQSQLAFYQDAQQAIDSVGVNPELSGRTEGAISGRAFLARQQGGMTELQRIFARHSEWKQRVYRQIWARIKQFWTEEKWVRVTDEEQAMRFVGLNIPVTRIEKELEARSGKDINDLRSEFGDQVDAIVAQSVAQNPAMGEVVETRNDVAELDMDIVIEDAPDTVTIQQEQFETLAQLAASRADPQMFQALVKLSTIKNKDEILDMFKPDDQEIQAQQQAAAQAQQIQQAAVVADIEKTQSETQKNIADVQLKEAQAKDEMASAVERVGKTSVLPFN